jgi:hypothetical protein
MGSMGHVMRMSWMRNAYKILVGNPERKIHFGNKGVDIRIILK